ncbi:MAG: hypothetical protein Q9216_002447, partial [Gyalolechia sp. 2 TL-2023]
IASIQLDLARKAVMPEDCINPKTEMYFITELLPVYDTNKVMKQVQANNEVRRYIRFFRPILQAANGAYYFLEKSARLCTKEEIPKAQQAVAAQEAYGRKESGPTFDDILRGKRQNA